MIKQSKIRNSFTTSHQQLLSHFQKSRSLAFVTANWDDKCHNSEITPFLLLFPRFFFYMWCHRVWNIPLVTGISCPRCVAFQLLGHSHLCGGMMDRKGLVGFCKWVVKIPWRNSVKGISKSNFLTNLWEHDEVLWQSSLWYPTDKAHKGELDWSQPGMIHSRDRMQKGEDWECKGAEGEGRPSHWVTRFTVDPLPNLPLELLSALCLKDLAALNHWLI